MHPCPGPAGYMVCSIYKVFLYVHIEVLTAFVGPRPPGLNGLHKDDNKKNNRLNNLEWGTQARNVEQASINGRLGKFSPAQIKAIRSRKAFGHSVAQIAGHYGVYTETIRRILKGESYKHVL